jgi:signal transduction histidine kinase
MKNHLRKKLFFLTLFILTAIGLIGFADYKSNQKLLDSAQWVHHTERVIYQSDNIYSLSKDIEILTQGCIITNDSTSLEPRVFPKTIFIYIRQLRELTLDNPRQQQQLDSLTLYMFKYLDFSYKTIELRNREGLVKAIAFVATREGKRYADRINAIVKTIQQEESLLLKQRTKTNEASVVEFKRFSVIMLVLMGVLTVFLLIAGGKYFLQSKEKKISAAELIVANEELVFQTHLKDKAGLERVRSEKRLEETIDFDRNNLAALINNTDDMMWSIDMDLQLITFNEAFNKSVIMTTGKPLRRGNKIISAHANENRWNTFKILYEKALKGNSFTILDRLDYPAEIWSEVSFYPLRSENTIIGTACFSRDVTERTMNERAFRGMEQEILNQKIQEQKKIARAILIAQEKERNYIGQELHDNISQILVSSKLFLSAAGNESEAVKELVKYPMELIDSSIQEIRLLSSRHVTPIKDVDLQELVHSLLDSLQENTSINTTFRYYVSNRELSDDLKLNIYRIIQEQINNIVKHAAPGKVDISIQAETNGLHIEMRDDGNGFDINKKRKGIGISNMMNRIESFNGQMLIDSSPGNGCSVHIDIPY